jgi:hypothetical protein
MSDIHLAAQRSGGYIRHVECDCAVPIEEAGDVIKIHD